MCRAKSSWYGTSRANTAPVAGALKIAATPAAAPATSSTRRSASPERSGGAPLQVRRRSRRRCTATGPPGPSARPSRAWPGRPAMRADERPHAERGAAGRGRRCRYSSAVAGDAPPPIDAPQRQRDQQADTGQHGDEPRRQLAATRSKRTSTTSRSKPATNRPVTAPVTAASSDDLARPAGEGAQLARGATPRSQRGDVTTSPASTPAAAARRPPRRRRSARRPWAASSSAGTRSTIAARSRRRRTSVTRVDQRRALAPTARSSSPDGCRGRPPAAPASWPPADRTAASPSTDGCRAPRRDHRPAADHARRARPAPGTAAASRRRRRRRSDRAATPTSARDAVSIASVTASTSAATIRALYNCCR